MPKRVLHILAICIFAITMLGADSPDTRFERLGHNLVCQCGCTQILLECNHVGCPVSPVMIKELQAQIATGLPSAGVLNFFIAKYGPIVLASPSRGGFDNVAWIVPFVVFVFGIFGVAFLIRFWKGRHDSLMPATPGAPPPATGDALHDRIRRDTDYENWSGK
jgi:cytochrome c-type biogenesis protein CcmH/NrfF